MHTRGPSSEYILNTIQFLRDPPARRICALLQVPLIREEQLGGSVTFLILILVLFVVIVALLALLGFRL